MGKLIKDRKKFVLILAIWGILIGSSVFALQGNYPPSPFGTKLTDNSTIGDLVMYIYQWGITLGGLALFVVLVIAGFQYLASAGSPTAMKSAKDRITSAGIGIAVLLGSYLILNTINPQLTSFPDSEIQLPSEPTPGDKACLEPKDCCKGVKENYELCVRSYKCENGVCVLKMAESTPCDKGVTVTIEGRGPITLFPTPEANCHSFPTDNKVALGTHYTFVGDPEGCNSNLYFFQFRNCQISQAGSVIGVSVNSGKITVNFSVGSIGLDYPF